MKKENRAIYVVSGVLILLFAGMIYAWSVLEVPMEAEFTEWNRTQISLTFTFTMMFFCLGCLSNGLLANKLTPAWSARIAAAVMFAGLMLSSVVKNPLLLILTFGVIAGFGSGFVYNAVLVTVNRWFPDKQGLISGICLMAFGISAFLVGKIYQAFTPSYVGGWRASFRVMACLTLLALVLGSLKLRLPDHAIEGGKKKALNPDGMEADTATMLKTPTFWMYFAWAILLSAAGLMLVSQASGIALRTDPAVSGSMVATAAGLISVFNGIGRVIVGALFDKFGRAVAMAFSCIGFALTAVVLLASTSAGSFGLMLAGFILGGLSYGGVTPVNSAFVSSYFGLKHYPTNYSVVNLNLIIASFGSVISGALYDRTGAYTGTFILLIALAAVAFVLSTLIGLYYKNKAKAKA